MFMMRRGDDGYKNGKFTWFMGEVEDITDKQRLNRVKVRCFGYYDNPGIKTKDLPWATVMMPTTSASLKGNGANHHLEVGSWVVGFFRDGPSAQDPIVMGSIATQTSTKTSSIMFKTPDNPNGDKWDTEQDIPSESSDDNKVYKSKAGHLIEIDNTEDKETLRVTHAKGAIITIDKDNNLSITNSGQTNLASSGQIIISSGKELHIMAAEQITLRSSKKTKII